ncbi:DUF5642 family protein [Mycolicibacterium neoaurum]|uniref:DUF5642 family protein n=1 Tax=Mycolicibacterium neoaurum TaxID=1795 RepID=UPI001BCADF1E|nr:DUF5642 family protein [Mycolicibacterium neoaurum]QVI29354.1 DUF5642 family protein [Mycolicibacterium neoaurum]
MRGYAIGLGAVLVISGCSAPTPAPPTGQAGGSDTRAVKVMNPAAVQRVQSDLPPGYEVTPLTDNAAPAGFWGMTAGWAAEPGQCAALADPGAGAPTHGWSASGPGGIIHAVVAGPGTVAAIPSGCQAWTLRGGRTTATVTAVAAPDIPGMPTAAMSTVATTVVEGGTETRSHADTAIAYPSPGYVVTVTVVTDPGSALPELGPDVAGRLLRSATDEISGSAEPAG